jgi:hypothetical protein
VVDAERLRRRSGCTVGEEDEEEEEAEEYLDSDRPIECVFDDEKRTREDGGVGWDVVRGRNVVSVLLSSSSSSLESAYARPSNSDSAGESGVPSDGGGEGDRGAASKGDTLFLNFSKNGMEGVLGVAGKGTFGGSVAGGSMRSRRTTPPSSGDGVRVKRPCCVGVTLFVPSRDGDTGLAVDIGDCSEFAERGEAVEPGDNGGVFAAKNKPLILHV